MFETQKPTPNTTPPTPGATGTGSPPPTVEQPKKRGRPFGRKNASAPLTETPVLGADGQPLPDVEPQRRKRRTKALDKDAFAKQLMGAHMMAAKITGLPFVQIDSQEASLLADAIENVAREYDLELSGKTGAFLQLAAAAALVYGPRVILFQAIKKRAARGEMPATVEGVATEAAGNGSTAAA